VNDLMARILDDGLILTCHDRSSRDLARLGSAYHVHTGITSGKSGRIVPNLRGIGGREESREGGRPLARHRYRPIWLPDVEAFASEQPTRKVKFLERKIWNLWAFKWGDLLRGGGEKRAVGRS